MPASSSAATSRLGAGRVFAAAPSVDARTLTPWMMVLGMVVQKSDTPAGVAQRLGEQFADARFPPNSAHTNLPRMAENGYVRLVKEGPSPSLDLYEATRKGREHFRRWMRRSVGLPPTIRNVLQGKLEFADIEDLPELLLTVRAEEAAYTSVSHIARARLLDEQDVRRRTRGRPVDPRVRMRSIQSEYEANLWITMSQCLEELGDELEKFLDELAASGGAAGTSSAAQTSA